jgi:hypothetical protein
MASEASVVLRGQVQSQKTRVRGGSLFFFIMPLVLLAIVLFGFAPSLYLRPLFTNPPIPSYLYVHGAILTTWFVWLVAQASLVRAGRVSTHRKMGVVGGVIALAVTFAGPMATAGAVRRARAAGADWDMDMSRVLGPSLKGVRYIAFESGVAWGNLISIVSFVLLVSTALLLRKHPQAHKRLMLLASISIIPPALARISRLPHMGGEGGPMIAIVFLTLLLAVPAHDLLSSRRLHPATLAGCAAIIAAAILAAFIIAPSSWGQQLVRMMA